MSNSLMSKLIALPQEAVHAEHLFPVVGPLGFHQMDDGAEHLDHLFALLARQNHPARPVALGGIGRAEARGEGGLHGGPLGIAGPCHT